MEYNNAKFLEDIFENKLGTRQQNIVASFLKQFPKCTENEIVEIVLHLYPDHYKICNFVGKFATKDEFIAAILHTFD